MKQPTTIGLIDCNNFYVSCERLFRPDLKNKPVAVLSNNDGCIVARSQEVKDLGIKMAAPVHHVNHLIKEHNIHLFSSNYTLYADLSSRIMQSLTSFSPHVDVYSIDEAFISTEHTATGTIELGHDIKDSLSRWVGIPVGVGFGPTKTLAKLANYAAKRWPKTGGVVDITDINRRKKVMQLTPVNDVWGVGKKLSEKLNTLGINTAWELQSQSASAIRQHFNITLAHTVQELQGSPVMTLSTSNKPKQQIVCSRSFKRKLSSQTELAQVISVFCLRAAEKLRTQAGVAREVRVFIRTSPFDNSAFYSKSARYQLKFATQDSRDLLKISKKLLKSIYKEGYQYQQAGVSFGDIQPIASNQGKQLDIFSASKTNEQSLALMKTIDNINRRFNNTVSFAATGNKTLQQSVPINRSGLYTTDWKQLYKVK